MNFEPRSVPPRNAFTWFRDALSLTSRQPLAYIALTLVFAASLYAPGKLAGFLMPFLFGIGCIIAESADKGRSVIALLRTTPLLIYGRLLIGGNLPTVLIFMFALTVQLVFVMIGYEGDGLLLPSESSGVNPPMFSTLAVVWFWFVCFGYVLWFAFPLMAVARLPLRETLYQTLDAMSLNSFVIWVYVVAGTTLVCSLLTPILVIPWVAVVSAMMYVSYRDIWLSRTENEAKCVNNMFAETGITQRNPEVLISPAEH